MPLFPAVVPSSGPPLLPRCSGGFGGWSGPVGSGLRLLCSRHNGCPAIHTHSYAIMAWDPSAKPHFPSLFPLFFIIQSHPHPCASNAPIPVKKFQNGMEKSYFPGTRRLPHCSCSVSGGSPRGHIEHQNRRLAVPPRPWLVRGMPRVGPAPVVPGLGPWRCCLGGCRVRCLRTG